MSSKSLTCIRRQSMSFVEEICYGDIEVRKLLKARVAYLSLHDGGELC